MQPKKEWTRTSILNQIDGKVHGVSWHETTHFITIGKELENFLSFKTVTLFYVLSHVPLLKYHRPTHHHLLACVALVFSVWLEDPHDCYGLKLYVTWCLMSHPGYTWWCHQLPMAGYLTRFWVTMMSPLGTLSARPGQTWKTGCNAHFLLAVWRNQTSHLGSIAFFTAN